MACTVGHIYEIDFDKNTSINNYISKELFIKLKKGYEAFPLDKRMDAAKFDESFRLWMTTLCQINKQLFERPSLTAFTNRVKALPTPAQANALSREISGLIDGINQYNQELLQSVSKASMYMKSFLSTIGVQPRYYDSVHDDLFSIKKAILSTLQTAKERVAAKASELQLANSKATYNTLKARLNKVSGRRTNANMAESLGLPRNTPLNVILRTRLNRLKKGGKQKTKRNVSKRHQTRRRA